jgi:SAM-dependent methyltransferase
VIVTSRLTASRRSLRRSVPIAFGVEADQYLRMPPSSRVAAVSRRADRRFDGVSSPRLKMQSCRSERRYSAGIARVRFGRGWAAYPVRPRAPVGSSHSPSLPSVEDSSITTPLWADAWRRSWDRLQERYVPDRELRIGALLDVVDAILPTAPTVLDLACGTGTITRQLLDRVPTARSIAVDVDPVLLTIASASFADDDRVRIVCADLRDPAWGDAVPEPQLDAVVTATALHWLPEHVVRRLYGDLAGLVRAGGVVAHAEEMPLLDLPRLAAGLAEVERERHDRERTGGQRDWDAWWDQTAADPALTAATAQRQALFGGNYPTEEFSPAAEWHVAALTEAGFTEVGVVWRSGTGAVVAAVR